MKINNKLLSFRYSKRFFLNRNLLKKIEPRFAQIKQGAHSFCPICSGQEVNLISEVDRDGFPCDTVICIKCDFVFNNSYITNSTEFYGDQFGKDRWGDPEKSFINRTSLDAFTWKRFSFLIKTLDKNFSEIETILEIGCGDGCNLWPYQLIGKSVVGCDLSLPFLEVSQTKGLNLILGDADSIKTQSNFDLILLIHSFEHIMDMDATVQSTYKRLKDGGFVFVEVPGIINWNQPKKGLLSDMGLKSSNNFLKYLQFEHNYHFSLEHLKTVWERNGFELVYGDEWVRAIFIKKDKKKLTNKVILNNNSSSLYAHLKNVEKDFLKFTNLLAGIMRRIIR